MDKLEQEFWVEMSEGLAVVNVNLSKDLDEIKIFPLADVHVGAKEFNEKQLDKWINHVLEAPNNYVVINGDLIDNITRHCIAPYFNTQLTPLESIEFITKKLQPIKDRILVVIDGNHELRSFKEVGISPLKYMCSELGISDRYVNNSFLMFIGFGKNNGRETRKTVYSIFVQHGSSSGRTMGGKLNQFRRLQLLVDADIYISGHTHQPSVFKKRFVRVNYRDKKVIIVTKLFVNNNAFLNLGGYGLLQGYDGSSLDYPVITLQGRIRKATAVL